MQRQLEKKASTLDMEAKFLQKANVSDIQVSSNTHTSDESLILM